MGDAPSPRRRLTSGFLPVLAAAGVAALGAITLVALDFGAQSALPDGCIVAPSPRVGGAIALTNQAGQAVTQATYAGAPSLLYFGFTHCPDVCPMTLYRLGAALEDMGDEAEGVHNLLITVDPERDGPAEMAAYVAADGFPAGLVGLTGRPDQVRAALAAFHVFAQRRDVGEDGYNVDHSSLLYVLDGQWRVQAMVNTPSVTDPAQLQRCLRAALRAARRAGAGATAG